ncbi:hypothetical protein H9Y04_00835 [Streptomyces sp. TRM66268-LWL]|uniref:Integral membrane protein n=1 Tax=Streptomyces polyasparticus TaxID=2767826 RepID=A0ABR7S9A7_9ACTN|nr:hypothetical protein [Streptomyces polyasparticus]MBC9711116.1 hypothetical protein [Streptomyces polyasparticus]
MFLEALASVLLGLALALLATHRLAHRLPSRNLVLATGAAGALFGAFVTHSVVGPGNPLAVLAGAVVLAVASLSLLLRNSARPAFEAIRPKVG